MNEEELRRHLTEKHGAATSGKEEGLEAMHRKLHQWASRPQDRHEHEAPRGATPEPRFRW